MLEVYQGVCTRGVCTLVVCTLVVCTSLPYPSVYTTGPHRPYQRTAHALPAEAQRLSTPKTKMTFSGSIIYRSCTSVNVVVHLRQRCRASPSMLSCIYVNDAVLFAVNEPVGRQRSRIIIRQRSRIITGGGMQEC